MTDTTEANWMWDLFRGIGRFLDNIVYWLLGLMYEIFFNVASAELFTNETVKNFYGRVQLILGVFMIFKLAVSIVKGIVNPDTFTDKNNGMGNIVMRIVFSLVMLTLIVPINIPNARNEYEIQLNNNGLLFGTLYSLQNRILSNNTLGRLILGTTDNLSTNADDSNSKNKLKQSADLFTSTILKGFIRINVTDESIPETQKQTEQGESNWVCEDEITSEHMEVYTDLTAGHDELLALTTVKCDSPDANGWQKFWNSNQSYAFAYKYIISAIVGGIFVYILVNFTIDIAIRAIKLAILRLIAPIPIISYIDPSGQKKMFDSWVKNLTSTYLDLFIRLAIIYFVIFLIQDIIVNGLVINQATGAVGIFTYIFIFLGLFIFAKQAPKFIKQLFGMKDDGGKMFGSLGEALGIAGGLGAAAVGMVGSGIAGYKAAKQENDEIHTKTRALNGIRNFGSAMAHAISGGYAGVKAVTGAKDHQMSAAIKAVQQKNATRAAHSTFTGRIQDNAYGLVMGKSLAARDQGILDANKAASSSLKNFKSLAETEAKKKGDYGFFNGKKYNYERLVAAMNAKDSSGNFTYDGQSYNVRDFGANEMAKILDSQTARYLQKDYDKNAEGGPKFKNGKLQTQWEQAAYDMGEASLVSDRQSMISYFEEEANPLNNQDDYDRLDKQYGQIGKTIGTANAKVSKMSTSMKNVMHRANNQANKK